MFACINNVQSMLTVGKKKKKGSSGELMQTYFVRESSGSVFLGLVSTI